MGAKGPGGGGEDKDSYGILWAIALIFVVGMIVWYFYSDQIKYGFMKVKYWELTAISYVIHDQDVIQWRDGIHAAFDQGTIPRLTMYEATQSANLAGEYLRYPISILLGFLAWLLYRGSATMRFNKIYDMNLLARQEKENWPQIAPVVDLNLIKEDINKGPWAMAMNPMQFAKHYKLLKVEVVQDKKALWKSEGVPVATMIKEKAIQLFTNQLGPLWTGPENLPPHTKAIYAAFLLRVVHEADAAREFFAKLSKSASKGTVDYSEVDDIIKKYKNDKAVLRCQKNHAYVLTVMATMLELARADGVQATADFLWIKPVDRRLWYMLNCVGRQVAASEVGGPFAHWLAEKQMGRPLSAPMIEGATVALEKALANMIYVPDEGEELPPPQQVQH